MRASAPIKAAPMWFASREQVCTIDSLLNWLELCYVNNQQMVKYLSTADCKTGYNTNINWLSIHLEVMSYLRHIYPWHQSSEVIELWVDSSLQTFCKPQYCSWVNCQLKQPIYIHGLSNNEMLYRCVFMHACVLLHIITASNWSRSKFRFDLL